MRDYLLSDHLQHSSSPRLRATYLTHTKGHSLLAELCLSALVSYTDYDGFTERDLGQNHFLIYAAQEWLNHAVEAGDDTSELMNELVFQLFTTDSFLCWHNICLPGNPARLVDFNWPKPKGDSRSREELIQQHIVHGPVSYACEWPLDGVLRKLLDAGYDANELTGYVVKLCL